MTLEDYIFTSIWNYPSLYYKTTFAKSRRSVLSQLFLVIGTGVEYRESFRGFSDSDENKTILSEDIKNRIKNGDVIVRVGKPDKKDDWILLFPDRSGGESKMFFSDFLKTNQNYYEFGQERPEKIEYWPIVEKFPEESKYNWEPYPFSIEYCPFWDRINKCLIPKDKIASDWVEGIVEIFQITKDWFKDDEKWENSGYYNWGGKGWRERDNIFLKNWEESTDKLKLCDEYEIPRKEYSSPREMAVDICKKSREEYISECNKILAFYK